MRKLIISFLLVSTAAMPALAQDRDGSRRDRSGQSSQSDDSDRSERRAERRAERAQRAEAEQAPRPQQVERVRVQRVERAPAVVTPDAPRRVRVVRQADNDGQQTETRRVRRGDESLATQIFRMRNQQPGGTTETRHDRDHGHDSRRGGHGEYHRDINRDHGELHASDPTRREHRAGHRDLTRQHDRRHSAWNTSWRNDRSYDWRRYRDHNRSIFRFGRYYDPYRYSYRRFSIGFNLWPSYYSSNFWLNDPWQYRLPPAYGPYRWVRYYDDALLVNIYSGEVVDVIHSFFW